MIPTRAPSGSPRRRPGRAAIPVRRGGGGPRGMVRALETWFMLTETPANPTLRFTDAAAVSGFHRPESAS